MKGNLIRYFNFIYPLKKIKGGCQNVKRYYEDIKKKKIKYNFCMGIPLNTGRQLETKQWELRKRNYRKVYYDKSYLM